MGVNPPYGLGKGKEFDMADIVHRVGIRTKPGSVFRALTTLDGLSRWWVAGTKGNPKAGGILHFGFTKMKVIRRTPNSLVEWKCVAGPDEWVGTTVSFRLKPRKDQTFVLFKHAGWNEPVEFMYHRSTKWATFLLSLRDWLKTGAGRPSPYNLKIHAGD